MSAMPDSKCFDLGNATMVTMQIDNGRLGFDIAAREQDRSNPALGFVLAAAFGGLFWGTVALIIQLF